VLTPIKIVIPGSYWDSWVYRDNLYLFGLDGSIARYSWCNIVSELFGQPDVSDLGFNLASNASIYYTDGAQTFLKQNEHASIFKSMIHILNKADHVLDQQSLQQYGSKFSDVGIPSLHTDIGLYGGNLYTASPEGVFCGSLSESSKKLLKSAGAKHSDVPGMKMSIKYGTVALAAGSEGLHEINIDRAFKRGNYQLSEKYNTDCSWLFSSILGFGDEENAIVYEMDLRGPNTFRKINLKDNPQIATEPYSRPIGEIDVFSHFSLGAKDSKCFGLQDKIGVISNNKIWIGRFNPWIKDRNNNSPLQGKPTQVVQAALDYSQIVSAGVTYFGVITELEDCILIHGSDNNTYKLNGPSLRWRVFPNSNNTLDIYLFTHDYFADQAEKQMGSYFNNQRTFASTFKKMP
jgi:hypothetical protein